MEKALLKAKGISGQVELLQDKVLIQRKGLTPKGLRGDQEIPLKQIASVEFNEGERLSNGYIQFVLGRQEPVSTFFEAHRNPTAVVFDRYLHRKRFEALKQAVEQRIAEREGPAEVPVDPVSQGLAEPEFEVEGKPNVVLGMARSFFESDEWPYPVARGYLELRPRRLRTTLVGPLKVPLGPDKGRLVVTATIHRPALIESIPGILVVLLLSALTVGLFTLAYLLYYLLLRNEFRRSVSVVANPTESGKVMVKVESVTVLPSDNKNFVEPVVSWVKRELVANKAAAAWAETPYEIRDPTAQVQGLLKSVEGAVTKASHNQRPDPVDQIRKLAELRDLGAITEEEFETKKSKLLDRM